MSERKRLPRPADLGFHFLPRFGWRSLALALGAGLAFGVWMALADTMLFASAVPEVQRGMVAQMSAVERIGFHARGALLDEVIFRGIGVTVLAWSIAMASGARGATIAWPAIVVVAMAVYPQMTWDYFSGLDPSLLTLLRELSLHGAAGVLWGWLYWRHGWLCAVAGHLGAHLALQPLLGLA